MPGGYGFGFVCLSVFVNSPRNEWIFGFLVDINPKVMSRSSWNFYLGRAYYKQAEVSLSWERSGSYSGYRKKLLAFQKCPSAMPL